MKKVLFLIASAFMMVPALAQTVTTSEDKNTRTVVEETTIPDGKIVTTTVYEKNAVFTGGFWKNWTLGVDLGAQIYYGDNDWKVAKFSEMITFPAIDLYLTKWASPSFGVGLGATYGRFTGLYQTTPSYDTSGMMNPIGNFRPNSIKYYNDAETIYDHQNLALQAGSYVNVYALAHGDLGNIFFGYNPNRFFDIDAYAGGGVIYGFSESGNAPGATFNLGLINMFRLSDRLRLMLNVRGAFVSDDFDGECYLDENSEKGWLINHKFDGLFGTTVGLTFNLDGDGWKTASRSSEYKYEKETIEKIVKETVTVPAPQVIQDIPEVWFHINFVVDKWDISKRELINLQSIADLIKSTPHTKYLVCGYADKQTATPDHNLMLSENRANAVYDTLVNQFGVPASQLVMDYKGGVDYMFYNEKELSRCVMINSIKN